MKKIFLFSVSIVVALIACNSSGDQQAYKANGVEDSLIADKQNDSFTVENLAIINETGFSKYARTSTPQLNWSRFKVTKFWQEDFQNKTAFVPENNYYEYYGQFLKYSPDSSKFIDLDSYNIAITKNENGVLTGDSQEPETAVSLVDLKKKEKMELVFLGPGNSIEDAAWIDNNSLILIGYLENDSATGINAAIWQYNLSTKNVKLYELSDDEVLKKLRNYTKRIRLKNVIIR